METMTSIRLPIAEFQPATTFYKALGFKKNPQFSDGASAVHAAAYPARRDGRADSCGDAAGVTRLSLQAASY